MIALITPTGARQDQFNLCAIWMNKQTYKGKVIWIIVDDCLPRTTNGIGDNWKDNWTIMKVYPVPIWQGQNTQARNIAAGIQVLINNYKNKIKAIFIIEDDDYYSPVYLERMMNHFCNFHLIGEMRTIYYNVHYRRYITNPNNIHASLFQTAFTIDAIPSLNESFSYKFIDCTLWSKITNKYLFYENDLAIGIKGMPGRAGIGAGHSRAMNMLPDPQMAYLRSKIQDDVNYYEKYYMGSQPQRRLFGRAR